MGSYHALCAHFQTKILLPLAVIMIIQCSLLCSMFLCSMELSPDLAPSFQLYIFLQICSKDTSFSRPSNLLILTLGQVCVRACVCVNVCLCVCLCVWVREREIVRARACVCVCKCIHRWLLPSPNWYAIRLGLMIRLAALKVFINITLHYIPTQFSWRVAQVNVFPW